MCSTDKSANAVKLIVNGSVFAFAWVWSFLAIAIAYWAWRQLALPTLGIHLPTWAEEHPVVDVPLRYTLLFLVIYFLIGGAINFFKGSTKVMFTILVRVRNPIKPISYEKFLQSVGHIRSIEQSDRGIAHVEKIRLVFGGIPLGLTWLAWWFAFLGLLHLTIVPLALPEVLSTFFTDGLNLWILFLMGLFIYFSFYYIGFLFILLLFYMARKEWHNKFWAIFFYFLGIAQLLLFFLSR